MLADGKRRVAHAQPWMAELFDIQRRSSKPINQEIAQPLFRARKVVYRIHRAENVILGNLPVERRHQPLKSFSAYNRIDLVLFH